MASTRYIASGNASCIIQDFHGDNCQLPHSQDQWPIAFSPSSLSSLMTVGVLNEGLLNDGWWVWVQKAWQLECFCKFMMGAWWLWWASFNWFSSVVMRIELRWSSWIFVQPSSLWWWPRDRKLLEIGTRVLTATEGKVKEKWESENFWRSKGKGLKNFVKESKIGERTREIEGQKKERNLGV